MGKEYTRDALAIITASAENLTFLHDDMEDVLKWTKLGDGDCVVEKSQALVFEKDYSLHLKTRVTNPADGDTVMAKRALPIGPKNITTVNIRFAVPTQENLQKISIFFQLGDGTHIRYANLTHNVLTGIWYITDKAGNEIDIGWTPYTGITYDMWNNISYSIDTNKFKYKEVRINDKIIDVSEYEHYESVANTTSGGVISVYIENTGAVAAEIYIDDVVVYNS